jgi:two-component system sensor histidine kinase UhpB
MDSRIRILVAEHDSHDLEMIDNELKRSGIDYVTEIVDNEAGYKEAIRNFLPDVILCDYTFPSFDGPTAFEIREQLAPETPFILVSGTIGDENSIELIKKGVTDFVLKDKIFTLETKLARALKEAKERKEKSKIEQDLKQSEARLVKAQAIARIGSWEIGLIDLQAKWSEGTYNIFEVDSQHFHVTHATFLRFIHPDDVKEVNLAFQASFNTTSVNTVEHRIITFAGQVKHVEQCWQIYFDERG